MYIRTYVCMYVAKLALLVLQDQHNYSLRDGHILGVKNKPDALLAGLTMRNA